MSSDAWSLIANDAPRMWDWYDVLGRWLGCELATDADAAIAACIAHLATDACLSGTKATITVRCLATDERARTTTIITTGLSCLPLY
jgi:hypothetical protein